MNQLKSVMRETVAREIRMIRTAARRSRSPHSRSLLSGDHGGGRVGGFRLPATGWLALPLVVILSTACVSTGDFLRLEERVAAMHDRPGSDPDPFARIAQLSADVDALRQETRDLQGDLELARKEAADALAEARQTRSALAAVAGGGRPAPVGDGAEVGDEGSSVAAAAGGIGDGASPAEELARYKAALEAWRQDDFTGCIDQFKAFLQTYPKSSYADDAAYWRADCTFRNSDFRNAVLRFSTVVETYPDSPKAPDAMYRQGESLIKLGPKYYQAARTVFKRVQKDFPDTERAAEAARQLERIGAG